MKIVICDDSIEDLMKIERLLQKYLEACDKMEVEIFKYTNPSALFDKICKRDLADIYILDMVMSEKTGIDIGSKLQKSGSRNVIIYITSSDDFALEAYRVHAARYLLKPVVEADFFEALDYALRGLEIKEGPSYLIKTKEGSVSVPYSKIEYIENVSRILDIHLTDGENLKSIFIRKSFDVKVEELLKDEGFIQVHKSFVINLKYIKKLTPNDVILESGKRIPVSKSRSANVKREYLLFVSKQYR